MLANPLKQITEEFHEWMAVSDKEAEVEFAEWQREFLRDKFNESITKFYKAYPAKSYKRQGDTSSETGGLYDLFELSNVNDTGAKMKFEDDYSDIYSEANMHSGRKGYDGLFQLVFVDGYHGGASSIDDSLVEKWGSHPDPGTPYWRRKAFVRSLGRVHPYGAWGSPAPKTTPPKDLVKSGMAAAFPEMTDKWKKIKKEHADKKFEEFNSTRAQKLINEFFIEVINYISKAVI